MTRVFEAAVLMTVLLGTFTSPTSSSPLPDRVYNHNSTTSSIQNKTIADLVQHQTDVIKKIVSNHQHDYPIITKYPEKNKKDDISIDELKIKCQHLARLLASSTTPPPSSSITPNGFYITTDETYVTTPRAIPNPAPVKYIKLEPVILQKTIMNDGRTIYYWHKQIPGQIAPVAPTSPPTTTTRTSTTPNSYGFRNFFPSFYSIGGSESQVTTTTEKTTTADEMLMYQQQLKFVVPVPFAPPEESGIRKPWDFDQYAYYPKPLQPENVNMQVPYVPTFHVIKAIAVPNQYESGALENT